MMLDDERRCKSKDCNTILSIYNKEDYCSLCSKRNKIERDIFEYDLDHYKQRKPWTEKQ